MTKLLSKNIFIYGGTNALKSLVPLLMLPILTKYLSVSEFGLLSLIETTILFLTPFILLNISAAINVEYFKVKTTVLRYYITNALILSLISFFFVLILVFIFKYSISLLFNIDEHLVLFLVLFSGLRVLSSVVLGLYQSKQEPIKFALFTISQTLIDFFLSYMFVVHYNLGFMGRLEGTYIAFFIFSVLGLFQLYKNKYLSKITFRYSKEILNYGVPLIPHALSGTVMAMSDRYFISYFIGNSEVGIYTIAYQLSALMLLAGMSANQAWSPMLFKLLKQQNMKQAYKFTIYLSILFFIIFFIIYQLKDTLFYLLIDSQFYIAKDYFLWLLIGFLFQSLYFLVANLLFYEKRTKFLAIITFSGAFLNIILNYYFINSFGTIGVAYATAITWGVFFTFVLIANVIIIKKVYT